jgi:predicted dithiol-disulfide oxidoreductase (DUF899 family)
MERHRIVSQDEWIEARKQHLAKEKEFTRLRDQLSAQRRALPWVRVDKQYVFEGLNGKESLNQFFAGKSQLVVQHFMFGPDWKEGCKSCSFWADNYNGFIVHLMQRDVALSSCRSHPSAGSKHSRSAWGGALNGCRHLAPTSTMTTTVVHAGRARKGRGLLQLCSAETVGDGTSRHQRVLPG